MRILFLLKSKTLMNMAGIFFEDNGVDLLKKVGMTKTEFARRMGIRKQNVNSLFKTKNLETIRKAADVLGVPFEMLIGYTSEPDLNTPVESGPFGTVYKSFKGKPKEAFWFLVDHQEGDLVGVFSRKDLGEIDLVWGDESCGVRHILLRHINEKDFPTVNLMIEAVSDVILAGLIKFDSPDKAVISRNGYQVIIRKNYRINGKKLETKNWVLTAYSKESSDTTQAPPGIN